MVFLSVKPPLIFFIAASTSDFTLSNSVRAAASATDLGLIIRSYTSLLL